METMAKEKGDMFDTMVVDEAKIRLGEEGWKERYYQVSSTLAFSHLSTSTHVTKGLDFGQVLMRSMLEPCAEVCLCLSILQTCPLHSEESKHSCLGRCTTCLVLVDIPASFRHVYGASVHVWVFTA